MFRILAYFMYNVNGYIMKNKRIVIVEDEKSIRDLYQYKLKISGYDVRSTSDGESGLELIREFMPDLILLDLMMPVMNGEDMLEKLREFDWAKDIRVIVLTNISKDEAPAKLRFLGVDRYVVKAHHTPQQIVDFVKTVLS